MKNLFLKKIFDKEANPVPEEATQFTELEIETAMKNLNGVSINGKIPTTEQQRKLAIDLLKGQAKVREKSNRFKTTFENTINPNIDWLTSEEALEEFKIPTELTDNLTAEDIANNPIETAVDIRAEKFLSFPEYLQHENQLKIANANNTLFESFKDKSAEDLSNERIAGNTKITKKFNVNGRYCYAIKTPHSEKEIILYLSQSQKQWFPIHGFMNKYDSQGSEVIKNWLAQDLELRTFSNTNPYFYSLTKLFDKNSQSTEFVENFNNGTI